MFLEGILAITGKPGLYKKVSQAKNSLIVESLETGQKLPAFSASKLSSLQDVAIYTDETEVPLADVLISAFEKNENYQNLTHKSSSEDLKNWFADILPNYDRDRVYVSDIKKIANWFNALIKAELLNTEAVESYRRELEEIEKQENEE
ncbi:MAG: DUF5606 domain-containing protein [Bacteroidales bacterium]|nr:DUF5606 domain-containing protein [Bacteroidales bacterium]